MSEIHLPKSKKISTRELNGQPLFPYVDLTDDNKDILLDIFDKDKSIDAVSQQLQFKQRYIYLEAQAALQQLGYSSKYNQDYAYSFSHGFAGFEAINDLVHEPRAYEVGLAAARAAHYLVDTTPHCPEPVGDFDAELQKSISDYQTDEQDVEADENLLEADYPSTEIPKDILRSLAAAKRRCRGITERTKIDVEQLFVERHHIIPEHFPNTYTVLVRMGISRRESNGQIQARLAGAQIARTLQTID